MLQLGLFTQPIARPIGYYYMPIAWSMDNIGRAQMRSCNGNQYGIMHTRF